MKAFSELKSIYTDIVNTPELMSDGGWKTIVTILEKEIKKDVMSEYVSIEDAIKIFLEFSNEYESNMFTRLCEAQGMLSTYYNGLVCNFIRESSALSDKRIEKMIKNLKIHYDLYGEIIEYILAGNTYKKALIKVEGYSAVDLYTNYELTLVGAYNYLIYLREDPEEALADLKAGLPRK